MKSNRLSDLAVWSFLICFVPMLLCCRDHHQSFRVELPSNYSGPVSISCKTYGPSFESVTVDATGHGEAPVCSTADVDILAVTRDGKTVSLDGPVNWQKTGDGLPLSLSFAVR